MDNNIEKYAKEALLSCIIGVISTIDLLNLKNSCIELKDKKVCNFYMTSVEEHSKMNIYKNPYIQ